MKLEGEFEDILGGPLNSENPLLHSIVKITPWVFHFRGIFQEMEGIPHAPLGAPLQC